VVVLAVYDGHLLPTLPMNITLNTFVAFFSTFAKSSFMIPVTEALSQWKWNIFVSDRKTSHTPSRPLSHFQILNSASRGTWGSWKLFLSFKWK